MYVLTAAEPARPAASPQAAYSTPRTLVPYAVRPLEAATALPMQPQGLRMTGGFVAWALLDRQSGQLTGSANFAAPGAALATVKPWLAADALRRGTSRGQRPTEARLRQLRAIVRGDDSAEADALYTELGGRATIRRLVATCGLTDSRPVATHWSGTVMSARDAARMGLCLADGRAAGARWTPWLLAQLRKVKSDFGVRDALPPATAATVAVRNGWLVGGAKPRWQVNCVAMADGWVLGVVARYPAKLGLAHGKRLCRTVGSQLVVG
jgi:hypothetical protein